MPLRHRCRERIDAPESFDEEELEPALVAHYLRDLEKVNRYLLGARSVLAHVAPLLTNGRESPLRVVDIGCGGGEVLRALAQRARKARRPLLGVGLDRNSAALAYARDRARDFPELRWLCGDASAMPLAPNSADVVISTTMLHHFAPERAVALLRAARSVTRGWLVISDLVRSYPAVVAFRAFARVTGFCQASRDDGVVSVRRSYRPEEVAELARAAGLTNYRMYRYPFARMALVCGPEKLYQSLSPRGWELPGWL